MIRETTRSTNKTPKRIEETPTKGKVFFLITREEFDRRVWALQMHIVYMVELMADVFTFSCEKYPDRLAQPQDSIYSAFQASATKLRAMSERWHDDFNSEKDEDLPFRAEHLSEFKAALSPMYALVTLLQNRDIGMTEPTGKTISGVIGLSELATLYADDSVQWFAARLKVAEGGAQ